MKQDYLEKAKENLNAARMLFDAGLHNASANRAYYAAFHAAIAALSDAGIKMDNTNHKNVQALFSGELIRRRKVYSGSLRSYLMVMQEVRNEADYRPGSISKKVTQRQLTKAVEFVDAVTQRFEEKR